jgi:hypothetical protein
MPARSRNRNSAAAPSGHSRARRRRLPSRVAIAVVPGRAQARFRASHRPRCACRTTLPGPRPGRLGRGCGRRRQHAARTARAVEAPDVWPMRARSAFAMEIAPRRGSVGPDNGRRWWRPGPRPLVHYGRPLTTTETNISASRWSKQAISVCHKTSSNRARSELVLYVGG